MKLLKASLFSGIIVIVRTLTGFISNKFVAIYLGPAGLALVGQFGNLVSIVTTFANGAINNGVIKYASEYRDNVAQSKKLYSNSLIVSLFFSIFIACILIATSKEMSVLILNDTKYRSSILALAYGLVLHSLNTLLISILNGRGQLKDYTIINVLGSFVSLIFTIFMVYYYNIEGSFIALALSHSIVFFFSIYKILKSTWFRWDYFKQRADIKTLKNLANFTAMSATSVLSISLSQILVRATIIDSFGMTSAGIWQGMSRIGESHLLIIVTALSTAYLPILSAIKEDTGMRKEIISAYKITIPFLIVSCLSIFLFRSTIITLLFSDDFSSMEELFLFQLIGNSFKVFAWILSFIMQARAMTKTYIVTEIIFAALYVISSKILIIYFGFNGIMIAFSLTYFIYFITVVMLFRKILFIKTIK